jgi:hypothetical protein
MSLERRFRAWVDRPTKSSHNPHQMAPQIGDSGENLSFSIFVHFQVAFKHICRRSTWECNILLERGFQVWVDCPLKSSDNSNQVAPQPIKTGQNLRFTIFAYFQVT